MTLCPVYLGGPWRLPGPPRQLRGIKQQDQYPVIEFIAIGVKQAFNKGSFIITGTGHPRGNKIGIEPEYFARYFEPAAHIVATGIAGKPGFIYIKYKRGDFASCRIRRQYRL